MENYINYRIAVPTDFEEVFSHFYFAKNESDDAITKTLLPSFQTILVFSFGAQVSLRSPQNRVVELEQCLVLGPIKQAFEYTLPPKAEILVASFKDDAFYRFFGNAAVAEHLPMHPDMLLDENCFNTLWVILNELANAESRVYYLLDFCRPYIKERKTISTHLANFKDQNLNPIKAIASELNFSERNIQLHHKKHLGFSAKELSRYLRFLKAIQQIQNIASQSSKIDWFDIVNECGYYDQSQLIHDFNHYLRLSPAKYLKFQQDICSSNL